MKFAGVTATPSQCVPGLSGPPHHALSYETLCQCAGNASNGPQFRGVGFQIDQKNQKTGIVAINSEKLATPQNANDGPSHAGSVVGDKPKGLGPNSAVRAKGSQDDQDVIDITDAVTIDIATCRAVFSDNREKIVHVDSAVTIEVGRARVVLAVRCTEA